MSGFSPDWLALREVADHRAIDHGVRRHLLAYLADEASVYVADLGCGTGSNFRSLAPEIAARQLWLLVDHDPTLLELAAAMNQEFATAREIEVRTLRADLSSGDIHEIVAHAELVTAAALFDLISPAVIETMADAIVDAGSAFYTVLTYDGLAAWLPEQPLNPMLREAFNVHQRTDKGFGPAAGPDATQVLAQAFAKRGYTVLRGNSPWVLDRRLLMLRQETDRGFADAAVESGGVGRADADAWIARRAGDEAAVTIVGHEDLLALPPK